LGKTVAGTQFPNSAGKVGYPFLPHHYMLLGVVMLVASVLLLVLCQVVFRRLENRFAERL
jgi:hypothetical protein